MLSSERSYNVIDKITELPFAVQPKLLCALEEKKSLSIGSDLRMKINTPVVAATQCDLDAMVQVDSVRKAKELPSLPVYP